jgi:DNA-binding MarR family transcriptional regulator
MITESLPEAVDATTAMVFREFLALGRLQSQLLHRAFAKQCLHPTQAICIAVLAHHGELAQSDLGEALVLSRPSVTRLLQRMERGGLVTRRPDAGDLRQTIVALTPAGRELQHRMHEATAEYAMNTLALLPETDRAELARILAAWRRLAEGRTDR